MKIGDFCGPREGWGSNPLICVDPPLTRYARISCYNVMQMGVWRRFCCENMESKGDLKWVDLVGRMQQLSPTVFFNTVTLQQRSHAPSRVKRQGGSGIDHYWCTWLGRVREPHAWPNLNLNCRRQNLESKNSACINLYLLFLFFFFIKFFLSSFYPKKF